MTQETDACLLEAAKKTTNKCIYALAGLKLDEEDEKLMQDFRSMQMQKTFPHTYKGVMENLHGPVTEEELTWGPIHERFYTLLTNDVAGYLGQAEAEGKNPLSDLCEYWYGMPRNVFCLAYLLEAKLIRHDQVKVILQDLFTKEPCGMDLYTYLMEKADFLNEPEVDMDALIREAIAANPEAAADLKKGKEKAMGRIMGAVLKKAKGNPKEIQEKIRQQLGRS